jgi:hypothetical protein
MRLTTLLCLLAAPSFAADVGIAVGSKIVTFDLPDGFVQSFEDQTDKAFIRGYVPEDKTQDELITLTVTRNLAGLPDLSLVDFLNFGLGALKAQCAGTFAQEVVSSEYTIAERPALGVFVSCTNRSGKPDGASQGTVFIAFRGPTDFYALQWSVDGPPLEATPAYDPAVWQARVDALVNSARLCDLAEPVVPCPLP